MTNAQTEARAIEPHAVRDLSGETRFGLRVAAYRETHPEHGGKFGHSYSEHWSTPNWSHPEVQVERLYTEGQLVAALSERDATIAAKDAELAELREADGNFWEAVARAERAEAQLAESLDTLRRQAEDYIAVCGQLAEANKALDEIINSDRIERRVVQYDRIYFQEHDGFFAEIARRAREQGGVKVREKPNLAMRIAYDELNNSLGLDQFANFDLVWEKISPHLTTEPAAPEGRQEEDAFDADMRAVEASINSGARRTAHSFSLTRPAEQAVTDAMIEAAVRAVKYHLYNNGDGKTSFIRECDIRAAIRAALTAALAQKEVKP